MTLTDFLSQLDGVGPRGTGRWSAKCPAHPDKSPSLSIKEGADGRILLHDFAGCTPAEIVAALGLTLGDLFADHNINHAELQQRKAERKRARRIEGQQREVEGFRLDQLREAEHLLRVARGISIDAMPTDDLDMYLQSIAGAHELLRIEMGEEAYAEFTLGLG
ncbi:MAG: hypothetical protein HOP32_14420 [Nitrospira sp.]|nr:hypothetical protein [Nitrospira sp.]